MNSPYLLSPFCWFVALNRQICQSSYVALAATKAGLFLLFISKIIFSCLSGNAAEIATHLAEKIFEAKKQFFFLIICIYDTCYLMMSLQRWCFFSNDDSNWICLFIDVGPSLNDTSSSLKSSSADWEAMQQRLPHIGLRYKELYRMKRNGCQGINDEALIKWHPLNWRGII